jgi:hypothetical protein
MATSSSLHGDGGARVFVELGEGAREGGSGGGEWTRRAPGGLQTRVEGAGGARGEGSVVGVLNQLGGIPPSSLGARGGRRQGEGVGWAGWASPWAPGKLFPFFFCLIFPFF